MKRNLTASPINCLPRCTHTSPSGRRCRSSSPAPDSLYCPRHEPKEDPAAGLVRDLDQFRSAADVTVFLSRLLGCLSRGEISTRRAAVLSYVSISLMHALRSLQRENQSNANGDSFDPLPISWNVPSSDRPSFRDAHEARAYFAQRYADRMRRIAEDSRPASGEPSQQAAHPGESPLQAYSRLRS
jgi:hypothetical protein